MQVDHHMKEIGQITNTKVKANIVSLMVPFTQVIFCSKKGNGHASSPFHHHAHYYYYYYYLIGEFHENKMHGVGCFIDKNGEEWKGRYYNNNGPGLVTWYS